nr:MAG TPA: Met Apo-repressor, MetJ [Caudoviricetes sp.]
MAGYDEDFWGEDFLEGEETTETEVGTEGEEGTEGTEGTEGAEGAAVDVDGEGTEDTEGGEGEDEGFSPDLLARIEAETQKRVDARIAREFEGILNPYTNQPIRTEADLTAYRSAFAAEEQRQQLEEMGVSKEVLDSYIQNHPAMQQAQQVIHQQEQQAANDFMAKEFEAMKKEFPDCGLESPQQLNETEAGRRALQMWANAPGITLADAYAATHRKELSKKQSAAAKQAAMNEMNSKGHLRQTKGSNAKGDVPAEIMREYKIYFPNATDAEIAEMYWKNQKATE